MLRVNGTMLVVARVRSARRVTLTRGWTTLSRSTWRPFRRSSNPILDFHDFHSNPLTRPTPLPPPGPLPLRRFRRSRRRGDSAPLPLPTPTTQTTALSSAYTSRCSLSPFSSSPFDRTPSEPPFSFPFHSKPFLLSLSTHSRSLCKLIASRVALAGHCYLLSRSVSLPPPFPRAFLLRLSAPPRAPSLSLFLLSPPPALLIFSMRRCERHEGGDREGNFKARVQAGKNALSLSLSLLQVPRHRYTTAMPTLHARSSPFSRWNLTGSADGV